MELCRVLWDFGKINYQAPMLGDGTIQEIVENDKRYGVMIPRNGQYFTYKVIGPHDEDVTEKQFLRAIKLAWQYWGKRADIVVKRARDGEEPDFRVMCRTPDTDERGELTDNTIMYQYFPINDVNHPLRGLCVVNTLFDYTTDGKPVSMHKLDPDNYPDPNTTARGRTVDIDQVFCHEFGHAGGLPHDSTPYNVMSPSYGIMAEHLTERDVYRMVSKYGVPRKEVRWFTRWWDYLRHRSDRY